MDEGVEETVHSGYWNSPTASKDVSAFRCLFNHRVPIVNVWKCQYLAVLQEVKGLMKYLQVQSIYCYDIFLVLIANGALDSYIIMYRKKVIIIKMSSSKRVNKNFMHIFKHG